VQVKLRSFVVVAQGHQADHEVKEKVATKSKCCWKATMKLPKMCDY
jgi:hypothetical protein